MPRFAANLSMLFTELPFLDRFAAAARAGFRAVEFLFPYEHEPQEVRRRLDQHRLLLVLHNLPAGDWAAGERGIACHPDRAAEFRDGVGTALRYARALGVPQLNCLAGKRPPGVSEQQAHDTLVANLAYAARRLREEGVRLLLEPINPHDIPGFFVTRTQQALDLLDQAGGDNLFLQYDLYHAQRTEGELAATLSRHLARIAHVQLADNPGRHEPGTGEIHWPFVLAHLDRIGYGGWVGCEYKPATTTEAGLGWLEKLS
jgi:hydroxypyruvate isomerase